MILVIVATAPLGAVDVVTICWVIDFWAVVLVDLLEVVPVCPLAELSDSTKVI